MFQNRGKTMSIDFLALAEPFPAGDIKWRVQSAWPDSGTVKCLVFPYITKTALETRLDEVCGPDNWHTTGMTTHELHAGVLAAQVGISIWTGEQWVTKFDVSDVPKREAAKGSYSGAFKRAGCKWGVGRYLGRVPAMFAETSKTGGKGWEWAELSSKHGGKEYYWKPPSLPAWALPSEEAPVTLEQVSQLKKQWIQKFAPTEKNRATLASSFKAFAFSVVGEFPVDDHTFWTQQILIDLRKRIEATKDVNGPSPDVPFE